MAKHRKLTSKKMNKLSRKKSRKKSQKGGDSRKLNRIIENTFTNNVMRYLPSSSIFINNLTNKYVHMVTMDELRKLIENDDLYKKSNILRNIYNNDKIISKRLIYDNIDISILDTSLEENLKLLFQHIIDYNIDKNEPSDPGYVKENTDIYAVVTYNDRYDKAFETEINMILMDKLFDIKDIKETLYKSSYLLSSDKLFKQIVSAKLRECSKNPLSLFDLFTGDISFTSNKACEAPKDVLLRFNKQNLVFLSDEVLEIPKKDKIKLLIFYEHRLTLLSKYFSLEILRQKNTDKTKINSLLKKIYYLDVNRNKRDLHGGAGDGPQAFSQSSTTTRSSDLLSLPSISSTTASTALAPPTSASPPKVTTAPATALSSTGNISGQPVLSSDLSLSSNTASPDTASPASTTPLSVPATSNDPTLSPSNITGTGLSTAATDTTTFDHTQTPTTTSDTTDSSYKPSTDISSESISTETYTKPSSPEETYSSSTSNDSSELPDKSKKSLFSRISDAFSSDDDDGDDDKKKKDGKPDDGKPGDGKPGDGKPGDGKPGDGKPGEPKLDKAGPSPPKSPGDIKKPLELKQPKIPGMPDEPGDDDKLKLPGVRKPHDELKLPGIKDDKDMNDRQILDRIMGEDTSSTIDTTSDPSMIGEDSDSKKEVIKPLTDDEETKILKARIEKVLSNIDIKKALRDAEYEFREEIPMDFTSDNNKNNETYSSRLSLSEKCSNMKNNIMQSGELKVSTDAMDLLDRCPDELYEEIIRKKISKLNFM